MIFIIKGFRTIVFIFTVISTMFWTICPSTFFSCLSNLGIFTELRTTFFIQFTGSPVLIPLAITRYNTNICINVFTNPSAQVGCGTSSIFKQNLTSLDSEFSISKTVCCTKVKEPSLPDHLTIAGGENSLINTFLKSISIMWNANILVQDLNFNCHVHHLQNYTLHHRVPH